MSATVSINPTATFNGVDETMRITRIYIKVTPSGNYAGAPGDTLDFAAGLGDFLKSQSLPLTVVLKSANPAGSSGYTYNYVPNTTISNGYFQVQQNGAINSPQADLGAEAYPAAVLSDTIVGYADFPRL